MTFDRLDACACLWLNASGEYIYAGGISRRVAVAIGAAHGTVGPRQVKESSREGVQGVDFDMLVVHTAVNSVVTIERRLPNPLARMLDSKT